MAKMSQDEIKTLIANTEKLNGALKASRDISLSIQDIDTARAKQSEINLNNEKLANELKQNSKNLTTEQKELLEKIKKNQEGINSELSKEEKSRRTIQRLTREANNQIKIGWDYLMKSDKVIRQTILNLGIGGAKADMMRSSFENSARQVAYLGGGLEDVRSIMEGYADETGRARVMSASMVKDITAIGKGTGLGIEQATKLGAQFEIMGFDARTTMEYVQGVVDTSERMGVNTTKVLKNVNDNFKRLNTYTFQQGVKGFAQMSMYAEKFKIDITQALNAADIARTLEGAIDLAAQLQIMGGEFAKTDPFELLFLSRNDPAKFTEKIADMTKGVVTFRKMADGSFEKFISPADRDRLAAVAKSLGMEVSALTEIAERQTEIQRMRQQMGGLGLSKEQKEIIEGAAIFNAKSGKFQVEIAGTMKSIGELTSKQADAFVLEKKSLEERAIAAQDFESAFKATIEEFKTILLPMLRGINSVLTTIRPIVSGIAKWVDGFAKTDIGNVLLKGAVMLLASGYLFNKAFSKITGNGMISAFRGKNANTNLASNALNNTATSGNGLSGSQMLGKGKMAAGKGKMFMGAGAGVGAAALGIGAGIGAGAAGISLLADAMAKLKPEQAEVLKSIVNTLGLSIGITTLAAAGIVVFGKASEASAGGLGMFALAALGVGTAIGIAAAGIGYMAKGFGEMMEKSKGAGIEMMDMAKGVAALGLGLAAFSNPLTLLGLTTFTGMMGVISTANIGAAMTANSMAKMSVAMKGSKDDFQAAADAIERISNANVSGGGVLAELSKLLKAPLKVSFDKSQVNLKNDVTLNVDKVAFMHKIYDAKIALQMQEDLKYK